MNTRATAAFPAKSFTPVPIFIVYEGGINVPLNTTLGPEQLVSVQFATIGLIDIVTGVTVEQSMFSLNVILTGTTGPPPASEISSVPLLDGTVELTVGEVVSGVGVGVGVGVEGGGVTLR